MSASTPPELAELADVSARIGADPLLVQGPGGNSSLKLGDALWVKASGVWLAQAQERPIFAGLSMHRLRQLVAGGETENFGAARLAESDPSLRPSIETMLHALMPHRAVLHAHAVNSMTLSVLADGAARARNMLWDVNWAWVPYARPGAPLAAGVKHALDGTAVADVLILQNHGVVVVADSPKDAEALLRKVERRLEWPLRETPKGKIIEGSARYEALPKLAALAHDAELLDAVSRAALFPDQAVFLGGAVPVIGPSEGIEAAAERVREATGVAPALMLAPRVGAFASRERTPSADALIAGLFEVARRLPAGSPVNGLGQEAVAALLGWEAEAYRIRLAAGKAD